MQKKALLLLLIALIMGGVVTALVNMYLNREVQQRAQQEVIKTTEVLVAALDLKTGMRLNNVNVKKINWPAENIPEGAFINVDQLLGDKPPIVIRKMNKNEIILPYKLSTYGARAGLTPKIPEDQRAITIKVDEIKGVAGFVLPGTFVDVLLTSTVGQRNNKLASRTLLQNVPVLAVDQLISEDEDNPKVVNAVTLQVSPHDGKKLALGQEVGKLSLALRNHVDASILSKDLVTTATLLESAIEPVKKVTVHKRVRRTPTLPVVEIIRGLEVQKQKVPEGKPLPGATTAKESN